jgi:hypothetical protein
VVGPARSGTTILAKLLNSHPQILITDEAAIFLTISGIIANSRKGVGAGLWYGKTYNQEWADLLQEKAKDLAFDFYQRVAAAEKKESLSYWGDKHPHYSSILPFINSLYPEARFIMLVRDPRDVAVSLAEMNKWTLPEAILGAALFFSQYRLFFSQNPHLPRLHVRFEEMVKDYLATAARVRNWLELPVTREVEEFCQEKAFRDAHGPMTADTEKKNFAHRVGRWRSVFGPAEERLANELLAPFILEHGYELS